MYAAHLIPSAIVGSISRFLQCFLLPPGRSSCFTLHASREVLLRMREVFYTSFACFFSPHVNFIKLGVKSFAHNVLSVALNAVTTLFSIIHASCASLEDFLKKWFCRLGFIFRKESTRAPFSESGAMAKSNQTFGRSHTWDCSYFWAHWQDVGMMFDGQTAAVVELEPVTLQSCDSVWFSFQIPTESKHNSS